MTPFYDGVIKKVLSLNYELIVFFTKKDAEKRFREWQIKFMHLHFHQGFTGTAIIRWILKQYIFINNKSLLIINLYSTTIILQLSGPAYSINERSWKSEDVKSFCGLHFHIFKVYCLIIFITNREASVCSIMVYYQHFW